MENLAETEKGQISRRTALKFVVFLGVVSLLADMTYEGARSIIGPYLAILGASATAVGFVAGFGELIGYALRLISGYISDRTGKYWSITLLGYFINLLAVPLLALAGSWEMAAMLMVAERMGKAIRTPARDALLSYATQKIGRAGGLDCTRPWTRSVRSSARSPFSPFFISRAATKRVSPFFLSRRFWPWRSSSWPECFIPTRGIWRSNLLNFRQRGFHGSSGSIWQRSRWLRPDMWTFP